MRHKELFINTERSKRLEHVQNRFESICVKIILSLQRNNLQINILSLKYACFIILFYAGEMRCLRKMLKIFQRMIVITNLALNKVLTLHYYFF